MVWRCMGWNGVGILCEVEGKMDVKQYCSILEDELLKSIQKLRIPEENVIFQQDNDSKYTSKLADKWFSDKGINVMKWPPQPLILIQ